MNLSANSKNLLFWKIFLQLIRRDLVVFRKEYIGKLTDMLITFIVWVGVFGYLLPLMGMEKTYGIFIMVGAIASFGIFDILGQSNTIINDIQNDRTISYLLLLPISNVAVFCYIAISWAIQSMLIALPLYFVGKFLFWNDFILSNVTWYQLFLAFITVNLFFGFFALWIVGVMTNLRDMTRLYFRFINPLFLLGSYFTPWAVYLKISTGFAYLMLLNPLTYVMEIMRAAIIGQEGFIYFWISFFVLWGFIAACAWHGISRLKRQLDCV